MKKTFDQLLQEIWEANNAPDLSNEVKVAILQLLAPDFVSDIQELFQDYDDTIANELEEKLNQLFCIDDRACETYDRSFDFEEWVENAEGPPHDIPRCYNCGAPLQQENGALCYECEPENDEE